VINYFPDGEKFGVGCADGSIRVYNDVKRTLSASYDPLKKHGNSVLAIKCYDDYLISAAWDNNLKIWDPKSESLVDNIHVSCPFKDAIDMQGNYVVVGTFEVEDHIKVYDIRKPNC